MYDKGDRVITPHGPGSVVYKRMAPPTFSEVAVYSVKLDSHKGEPSYSGTIFQAEHVKKENDG